MFLKFEPQLTLCNNKGRVMANTPTITVYMESELVALPCGTKETALFLELLWRETGADCDGEEEEMGCSCGNVHRFLLRDGV